MGVMITGRVCHKGGRSIVGIRISPGGANLRNVFLIRGVYLLNVFHIRGVSVWNQWVKRIEIYSASSRMVDVYIASH